LNYCIGWNQLVVTLEFGELTLGVVAVVASLNILAVMVVGFVVEVVVVIVSIGSVLLGI
jgi:hypothetical protein